ncbi:hypothetical protein QCF78_gp61 [Escherichia phage vB_EcoS-phiEc3]|uniref:hypothetical protein n=1 Tax=Escherichia phage vB_EcoS-phiEc3 TaxID=2863832 RepID=UPI001CE588D4|nr:hypothetical protein QCF78_gp61 [Escherichia phage vB_EcoS-phiEc3]QYU43909.1 hypothetical protein AAKBPDAN_00060 [Escherichia phage vB_EcoS-phiEc4]QZI78328.1 hypothetical protein MONNJMKB_00061 [Escherichia phage vB_EcoS-phiEc3]
MSNKNEVFEYLIDQLRQQVNNNRCEDLAHEVQSLKNQLRDASAQIKELQSELQHQIDLAAGVYRWSTAHFDEKGKVFKVERGIKTEQSGCRKEDTHSQGTGVSGRVREGGVRVTGCQSECSHLWHYTDDHLVHCVLCGLKRSDEAL